MGIRVFAWHIHSPVPMYGHPVKDPSARGLQFSWSRSVTTFAVLPIGPPAWLHSEDHNAAPFTLSALPAEFPHIVFDGLPLTLCFWLVVRRRLHESAEQRISVLL